MYTDYNNKQQKEEEIISRHFAEMGRKGGKANVEKHGVDHMRKIGALGGKKRAKQHMLDKARESLSKDELADYQYNNN